MGARIGRIYRNINLENRVHREISKKKPTTAPHHPTTTATAAAEFPNGKCPLTVRGQRVYVIQ